MKYPHFRYQKPPFMASLALAVLALPTSVASAAPITFDFSNITDNTKNTVTKTVDKVTVTLKNPQCVGGKETINFRTSADGLNLEPIAGTKNGDCNTGNFSASQFDLSFDKTVQLISYQSKAWDDGTYELVVGDKSVSQGNTVGTNTTKTTGPHEFAGKPTLTQGTTATFKMVPKNSPSAGGDGGKLKSITIDYSTKSSQTITFVVPSSQLTFGKDTTFDLQATASSKLPVTYTATGACAIDNGKVKLTGAGDCTVTASQAGNDSYNAAPSVTQTFKIGKATQTVSFTTPPTTGTLGVTVKLTASASSGLSEIKFISADTKVCTVSGNQVKFVSAGTCKITASQVGDANYQAAQASLDIFVAKPATVTQLSSKMAGDPAFSLNAQSTVGLPVELSLDPQSNGICELNGDNVTPLKAGICIIHAFQKGNATTNPAQAQYRFEIVPADSTITSISDASKTEQIITFQSPAVAMVDEPVTLEVAGGNSGQPVMLSSDTPTICTVSDQQWIIPITEGVCIIVAQQEGDGQFNPAMAIYQFPVAASTCSVLKGSTVVTDNCDGGGQTVPFAEETITFSENTRNSNLVLLQPVKNAGTLSDLTLDGTGAIDGGTLSGPITNRGLGVIQNVTLTGDSSLKGGNIAGTIVNQGIIENVTFSAPTKASGGVWGGSLQSKDTPAFLDELTIQENATVDNVLLGANVRLGNNVTVGNQVYYCRPQAQKVDTAGQITDYLSAKFCFNLPMGSAVAKGQKTPLTVKILLDPEDRATQTTAVSFLAFYNQQYYGHRADYAEKWLDDWKPWDGTVSNLPVVVAPKTSPVIGDIVIVPELQQLPTDSLFYAGYHLQEGLVFDSWGTSPVIQALSTAQIQAWTLADIPALTPVQLASLTKEQIKVLTVEQLGGLSANQVSTLTCVQIPMLPLAYIPTLTTDYINALTIHQIVCLTTDQIKALTIDQIPALTTNQIKALSNNQIVTLTTAQIQALTTPQIQALTVEPVIYDGFRRKLGGGQIGLLTTAQIQALTTNQVNALTPDQIAALTVEQTKVLTAQYPGGLSADQVRTLRCAQIEILSLDYIPTLTTDHIKALTIDQIKCLKTDQVKALTATQIPALTTNQLKVFTDDQINAVKIQALTTSQVQALTADPTIYDMFGNETSSGQIAALTTAQVQALTTEQIKALTIAQIKALEPPRFKDSIGAQMINAGQLTSLTTQQIQALTTDQIKALTADPARYNNGDYGRFIGAGQIGSLTTAQIQALTTEQFKALTTDQIKALRPPRWNKFGELVDSGQITSLTATQIQALTFDQTRALTTTKQTVTIDTFNGKKIITITNGQLGSLTTDQIKALTKTQIQAFSNEQIKALTVDQFKALSAEQISMLVAFNIEAGVGGEWVFIRHIRALTTDHIKALTAEQIKGFTKDQIQQLQAEQIKVLTTAQIQALTTDQIKAMLPPVYSWQDNSVLIVGQLLPLTATQIQALTATQIQALTTTQIPGFRPDQIQALTTDQVKALTVEQIKALTANQIKAMMPRQTDAFDQAQKAAFDARKKELKI